MSAIDRLVDFIRDWFFASGRIKPMPVPEPSEKEELELAGDLRNSSQAMQSSTSSMERATQGMLAMIEGRRREQKAARLG